jgi:uncharacterized protein (TIGR03083 family)
MVPPSTSTHDYAALFKVERARLLDLLASLGAESWSRPTPCPAWTMHGLAAHLVGDDLSLLARYRDDHHGTVPPEGVDEAGFIAWIDDLQLEWVHAARRLSPRLVLDLLRWLGSQVAEVLAGQDLTPVTALVTWAGPEPVPVWLDQARDLSEYWIHRQQLLEALDRRADLRPDLAVPILDALRWALPYRLGALPARAGDAVAIEVDQPGGPLATTWTLLHDGSAWHFGGTGRGDWTRARLSMTADEAWRLLTGNLTPLARRKLRADGEPEVIDIVLATRAVIGAPEREPED